MPPIKTSASANLVGYKQFKKASKALKSPSRVRTALRPAIQKGLSLIVKDAKTRLAGNKDSGALAKSLGATVKTNKKTGDLEAIIGPRRGKKHWVQVGTDKDGKPIYHKPTRYAHLVHNGTPKTKPNPFLEQALKAREDAAREAIAKAFKQHIKKTVARYKAKGKL